VVLLHTKHLTTAWRMNCVSYCELLAQDRPVFYLLKAQRVNHCEGY
jgi:hypothetical protein